MIPTRNNKPGPGLISRETIIIRLISSDGVVKEEQRIESGTQNATEDLMINNKQFQLEEIKNDR